MSIQKTSIKEAAASFKVKRESSGTKVVDYLIVGGGPAGLQLGYFFEKAGRDYLILEAEGGVGRFFSRFPRHRQLISINKVYTGYDDPEVKMRFDWNSLIGDDGEKKFTDYTRDYFPCADLMVKYLEDFAQRYQLNVRLNSRVVSIARDGGFRVTLESGDMLLARRVIVATGLSCPYVPSIPGIELVESYNDVSVDPEDFVNQRVLILGKGNSALEMADCLTPRASIIHVSSPDPIRLAWQSHFVGHLRAVNNNFLDTYQLKSQNAVLDCSVEEIRKQGDKYYVSVHYSHAGEEAETLVYDRVIRCTGFRMDTSLFAEDCKPALKFKERFPDLTSGWESVSVPDLFFAGTLMQVLDFKKSTSGFIHGFRYTVRSLFRSLEDRYEGKSWPTEKVALDAESLTKKVLERVNSTAGLWQLFSFLCDVITIPTFGNVGKHYEEMPIPFVAEGGVICDREYFTVNLEFGKTDSDPFQVERRPVPEFAHESFFLHPVVRYYRDGTLVDETHILEDLYGEWMKPEAHVAPLRAFFVRVLAERKLAAGSERVA